MKTPRIRQVAPPPVLKSKKFLTRAGIIIFLLILAALTFYYIENSKNRRLVEEVNNLNQPGKSCEEIINKIGDKSAGGYSEEAQIKLLELQMSCYADQDRLDQSISAAEELRNIYLAQGDKEKADSTEDIIESLQEGQALNEIDARNAKNGQLVQ